MFNRIIHFVLILFPALVSANEPNNNLVQKLSAEIKKAQQEIPFFEYNLISVDQFKLLILDSIGDEKENYPRLDLVMDSDEFNGRIVNMYLAAFTYMRLGYLKNQHVQVADQIASYFLKGFEDLLHRPFPQLTRARIHDSTLKVLLPEYRRKSCSYYLK